MDIYLFNHRYGFRTCPIAQSRTWNPYLFSSLPQNIFYELQMLSFNFLLLEIGVRPHIQQIFQMTFAMRLEMKHVAKCWFLRVCNQEKRLYTFGLLLNVLQMRKLPPKFFFIYYAERFIRQVRTWRSLCLQANGSRKKLFNSLPWTNQLTKKCFPLNGAYRASNLRQHKLSATKLWNWRRLETLNFTDKNYGHLPVTSGPWKKSKTDKARRELKLKFWDANFWHI